MGKILRAFVEEQLQLEPIDYRDGAESNKARKYAEELAAAFNARLSAEQRQLFDKVVDAQAVENYHYDIDRFICGYRLGVLMTMEVFTDADELLIHREGN